MTTKDSRHKHKKQKPKQPFVLAKVRIEQVKNVLDQVFQWRYPADAVLSHWFKNNGKAGARDRAEIAQAVYNVLRHLRRYRQFAQSGQGPNSRRLAILGLASIWSQDTLMPGIDNYELAWLEHVQKFPLTDLPLEVHYSLPDWLMPKLSSHNQLENLLQALNQPADLDLRVNTLKADRATVLAALEPNFKAVATEYSPWGIRLANNPAINRLDLFKQGVIEVQDEGSQVLTALVAPKRGEMVIDFCAGAGGKTLLLGAMMKSSGRLYAFDVSAARLARAKPRLAKSGLSNVVSVVINGTNDTRVKRLRGKADRVLVDAPCSGLGTLRRNPDIKWRFQDQDLQQLYLDQAEILQQAATCLKSKGRLVYATCSLLPEENEQQVELFLQNNPDFTVLNAAEVLASRNININFADNYLRLRPDIHGTDGFFAAVLQKN